jgi:fumarylacetoacetate (FAA) hydrolase
MRLATILPRGSLEPVPVASAPGGTWIELAGLIGREANQLRPALAWLTAHQRPLPERAAAWHGPRYRESEFAYLPPVVRPPTLRFFEGNEAAARARMARHGGAPGPGWAARPGFFFGNPTAIAGHGSEFPAPADGAALDFEAQVGVVIGQTGRDLAPGDVWAHVFGFTLLLALRRRDAEPAEGEAGLGPGKSADFATIVGPWLVARQALARAIVGERLALPVRARLNGRDDITGDLRELTHSIPRMLAEASRGVTLYPGDLIGTGAVAPRAGEPGRWLRAGDVVECEAEHLGTLEVRIAAEKKRATRGAKKTGA